METIRRFEDIRAWQKARELLKAIYGVSSKGTFAKDFALRDQLRRAALSIMSNIAEGFERDGDKEFAQFLSLSKGSCGEVRSQLYSALDQGHLTQEQFRALSEQALEISRLLSAFMKYLRQAQMVGKKFKQTAAT